jgi:hypothetical protein
MIVRGDYCILRFVGQQRSLIVDGAKQTWHCRTEGLDSNAGTGKPIMKVSGANYNLCDPTSHHIGTLRNFSLASVDTDALYQISTPKHTFAGRVVYVEQKGKNIYPAGSRTYMMPPPDTMQSTSGVVAGIGDPAFVKGTRSSR